MFKTLLRTLSAFSIVTITASAGFAQNTGDTVDCEVSQNQNLSECKVVFSDWVNSFARPRFAEPDILTPHNEFLRGYSTWLGSQGTADVTNWMYSGFNDPNFDLNTQATGGVAAYKATHANGAVHYYVGLLSGTDLGAPVSETSGVAVWYGRFQAISGDTTVAPRDIALNIDFGAARSINAFLSAVYGTDPFKITGTFNNQGVITGRVTHNASLAQDRNAQGGGGHLRGLIGQRGAVGTFVSDAGGQYAGGFTASPNAVKTVNIADWVSSFGDWIPIGSFDPFLDDPQNQFLTGYGWGISNRGVTVTSSMYLASDTDSADGLSAYRAIHTNGSVNYYAGILGNTDLGAPLTQTGGSVAWNGRFQVVAGAETLAVRDFVLNVTFSGAGTGSVDAFLDAVGTTDPFKIVGTFDENGVITGTVDHSYWLRHDSTSDGSGATLTGLIGQAGVVGAFVGDPGAIYAGGFVAGPTLPTTSNVEYADWVNSFGITPPPDSPDTVNPQDQFLRGTADGINVGGGVIVHSTFNLNRATFDGVPLGGDAADGVAYFKDSVSLFGHAPRYEYAAIFSGTDLGAPLTETEGTAKWYGHIESPYITYGTSPYANGDFTLDITFNAESADGSVGTVRALIDLGEKTLLEGKFDRNGVISGTVEVGHTLSDDGQTVSDTFYTSVLTGLIGEEGAVGVFVSRSSNDINLGGFVAVPKLIPFDPNVKFSDWVRSFGDSPPLSSFISPYGAKQTRFLRGTDTGLDTYELRNAVPQTLTFADGDFGGQSADGVAYMSGILSSGNTITTHHYAGILSGTYLGALLDAPVTAAWSGELGMIVSRATVAPRDITLNIDFANTGITIADTKTSNNTHFVNFNNLVWDEHGVITGEVTYNPGSALNDATNSPGTVRGLIGQQGAVGAFISDHGDADTNHNTPYAGGFVAVPSAVSSHVVNFSDWVSSFDEPPSHSVPEDETQQTRFLQGRETGLYIGSNNLARFVQPNPLTLADGDLGGQSADGVAYMSVTPSYKPHHYAGILYGTNLGAPLDAPVTAAWSGKLGMIVDGSNVPLRDISLSINFARKGITIADTKTTANTHFVNFNNLTWDTNGVITGEMTYNPGAALSSSSLLNSTGKVTGLIGQQGAVGAFISNPDNYSFQEFYSGGFVAAPPSE